MFARFELKREWWRSFRTRQWGWVRLTRARSKGGEINWDRKHLEINWDLELLLPIFSAANPVVPPLTDESHRPIKAGCKKNPPHQPHSDCFFARRKMQDCCNPLSPDFTESLCAKRGRIGPPTAKQSKARSSRADSQGTTEDSRQHTAPSSLLAQT